MRVGVTLPSMGHLAQPNNLVEAAKAAERFGYETLWVADRSCIRSNRGPNIR